MISRHARPQRHFSEFKKFFGFEDSLLSAKLKNDANLEFDGNKMQKIAVIVTSVFAGSLIYTMISSKRRQNAIELCQSKLLI